MTDERLRATNGPYCGEGCPAWGMWDLELAWCDVFKHAMVIEPGVGTIRCDPCLALKTQETWYPAFKRWREAIRRQDEDDKAAGKKPSKYLREEYRDQCQT